MWRNYIVRGAVNTKGYGERLLKDIRPEQFARKAAVNGKVIDLNHPAFNYGHLCLYPAQLAKMMDLATTDMEVPDSYWDLFKVGSPCIDDVNGSVYPAMDELTQRFTKSYSAIIEAFPTAKSDVFDRELEEPGRRERFGTVGGFVSYILLAHPQSHFGQVSAWRRCMGLGAA